MISIVTGILNRKFFLDSVIKNTVLSDDRLELVLVDGGSSDGSIEYIKSLNHARIKLIEVGTRSSYPHFMNLGIKHSSHDFVCQWNDDVVLINSWDDVFMELSDIHDFYLFNWKYGNFDDINKKEWLEGDSQKDGWCLCDNAASGGEIVVNYGVYSKKIFKTIGMYNNEYRYYYADGDMSYRANKFGFKHKSLKNIKVCSLYTQKRAMHYSDDENIYTKNLNLYNRKILPSSLEFLP
jgi:glycosyltransferase involved in cell wall biosynthesis